MRGFPPVQIFLLCLAFVVLAVPLSHLTGSSSVDKPVLRPVVKETKSSSAWLRLRYAHAPTSLSVKIGDQELVSKMAASPIELKTMLTDARAGVDVFLSAQWPQGTPDTAITVELEPDGLESRSETRWSSGGSLDEVLTFAWK